MVNLHGVYSIYIKNRGIEILNIHNSITDDGLQAIVNNQLPSFFHSCSLSRRSVEDNNYLGHDFFCDIGRVSDIRTYIPDAVTVKEAMLPININTANTYIASEVTFKGIVYFFNDDDELTQHEGSTHIQSIFIKNHLGQIFSEINLPYVTSDNRSEASLSVYHRDEIEIKYTVFMNTSQLDVNKSDYELDIGIGCVIKPAYNTDIKYWNLSGLNIDALGCLAYEGASNFPNLGPNGEGQEATSVIRLEPENGDPLGMLRFKITWGPETGNFVNGVKSMLISSSTYSSTGAFQIEFDTPVQKDTNETLIINFNINITNLEN